MAYTLIEGLRRLVLGHTAFATVSPNRIRLALLRTGAVVLPRHVDKQRVRGDVSTIRKTAPERRIMGDMQTLESW